MRSSRTNPTIGLNLHEAAEWARFDRGPARAWRRQGDQLAEVYFHGDLVVHACIGGRTGLAAIRAMHDAGPIAFSIERGCWPPEHSLLLPWGTVLQKAFEARPSPTQELPCYREDEATLRLSPNEASLPE